MRRERASDEPLRDEALSRRSFVRRGGRLVAGAAALGAGSALIGRRLLAGAASSRAEESGKEEPLPDKIPTAKLGRTGAEVSILGLGTALLGHQNDNNPELPKLIEVFSEAIDRGITYVDTARIYGRAEEALREVLKTRREKVFLATKAWAETYEEAEKSFHESLKSLGVDSVDVLHLHSNGDKDTDKVLGERGAWEFFEKAKKDGKARFLGITGHSRPQRFVRMLETDRVDVMMVVLNFVDRYVYGFEEKVLPVARKHKTGVMAMKVFGGVRGGFRNYPAKTPHPSQLERDHHRRSIAYAKTLEGVTGMVIGVHSLAQLHQNIRDVVAAEPLSEEAFRETCELGASIAESWTPRFGPVA